MMRLLPLVAALALGLVACDVRPALVGGGPEGHCPPGQTAIFDKLGGRTYVCQDEQLVLFVTCVERVAALTRDATDTYGGSVGAAGSVASTHAASSSTESHYEVLQRARADATAVCERFARNRTDKNFTEPSPQAPPAIAWSRRPEPPRPMSGDNPYAGAP